MPTSASHSGVHRIVDLLGGDLSGAVPAIPVEPARAEPARAELTAAPIDELRRTPPHPGAGPVSTTDLTSPELYLNRELTYLGFCDRVLTRPTIRASRCSSA